MPQPNYCKHDLAFEILDTMAFVMVDAYKQKKNIKVVQNPRTGRRVVIPVGVTKTYIVRVFHHVNRARVEAMLSLLKREGYIQRDLLDRGRKHKNGYGIRYTPSEKGVDWAEQYYTITLPFRKLAANEKSK
ncbi:MAG: hypothetical protein ACYCQJ_05240 [Nitrososphaerales archaeon]